MCTNFECEKLRNENLRFFYEQAVGARNFHYDNFSKWQTFFYVAIGAVLVAYCSVISSGQCCATESKSAEESMLKLLLPILGYVFSLIWLCSSKGYTYWWNAYMVKVKDVERLLILGEKLEIKNGEKLSKKISCPLKLSCPKKEREVEKGALCDIQDILRVYSSLNLNPSAGLVNSFAGANFSTSKLANALAFVSSWAWGIVVFYSLWGIASNNTLECDFVRGWEKIAVLILTPFFVTWLLIPILNLFFPSDISEFVQKICAEKQKKSVYRLWCAFIDFLVASPALIFLVVIFIKKNPPAYVIRSFAIAEITAFVIAIILWWISALNKNPICSLCEKLTGKTK